MNYQCEYMCMIISLSLFQYMKQKWDSNFELVKNSEGVYHRLIQNCWLKKWGPAHDNHGRICMKFLVFQKMQMKLPSKRPVPCVAKNKSVDISGMGASWVRAGWWCCRHPNFHIEIDVLKPQKARLKVSFRIAFEEIYSRWLGAEGL